MAKKEAWAAALPRKCDIFVEFSQKIRHRVCFFELYQVK